MKLENVPFVVFSIIWVSLLVFSIVKYKKHKKILRGEFKKIELDLKLGGYIKIYIYDYFLCNESIEQLNKLNIYSMYTNSSESEIKVLLHLSRPGLLIGKGGRQINKIKEFIEKSLKEDHDISLRVKFEVKENEMWKGILSNNSLTES